MDEATKEAGPLAFTLKRKTVAITLEDEKGKKTDYVLQDIDGNERDEYDNLTESRKKYSADGKYLGLTNVVGLTAKLVHLSLRDGNGAKLPVEAIEKWPASVRDAVYVLAARLCGIGTFSSGNG